MKTALLGMGILLSGALAAAEAGPAGVSSRWLNTLGNARAWSMASAVGAEAGGLEALDFNPAGLAGLLEAQAGLTQQLGFMDSALQQIALGFRLREGIGLGLGLDNMDFGPIQRYSLEPGGPVARGVIRPAALNLKAALGWTFLGSFSAGLGGEWLGQDLDGQKSQALAGNAGLRWESERRGLALAASALHFGSALDGFELPLNLRLGAAWTFLPSYRETAVATLDFLWVPGDEDGIQAMLGVEYAPAPFLALRGGLRQSGPASPSGFSLGLGLQWSWARLDYAYLRMGSLGFLQQFSLSLFLPDAHLKALSEDRRKRLQRKAEGENAE